MSKKPLSNETIKSVLDKHTKELANITSAITRLQINSAPYGLLEHKIEQHEAQYHKPRPKFNKKIVARIILGGLLALGCSSYYLWPSPGNAFLSSVCGLLVAIPALIFLVGTATGDIK